MKVQSKIHIGTSGWSYKHWKGTFYPKTIKGADEFQFYNSIFKTVEVNNSFYRLPLKETFDQWRKQSSRDFIFSVKASRYITHMKKLKDVKESLELLFVHVSELKEKLGPVLFQLPPGWKKNAERLQSFLNQLPANSRYAFEFRNHTWYDPEIYTLLRKYNCAFCIYELDAHLSPFEITADFVYIRLHGPEGKYQGDYSLSALKKWAKRCKEWQSEHKDVYIYFDNDQYGYAAFNAQRLQELTKD